MSNYNLTAAQQKAVEALERAFKQCEKAGVYLWDNYGTISAVNGRVVREVTTDDREGEPLDDAMVAEVYAGGCWHSGNSDDELQVVYR